MFSTSPIISVIILTLSPLSPSRVILPLSSILYSIPTKAVFWFAIRFSLSIFLNSASLCCLVVCLSFSIFCSKNAFFSLIYKYLVISNSSVIFRPVSSWTICTPVPVPDSVGASAGCSGCPGCRLASKSISNNL